MPFDFEANREVDTLDRVDAEFRSLYREKEGGGGFELDPAEDKQRLVGAFIGLTKSLASSRAMEQTALKEAKALKGWATLGDSPKAVQDQIADLKAKLETSASGKSDALEKYKQELAAQHRGILDAKEQEVSAAKELNTRMRSSLYQHMVLGAAAPKVAELGGALPLIQQALERNTEIVEHPETGEFAVRVVDPTTRSPRFRGADPMTVAQLVEELAEDPIYGRTFAPKGTKGAGTPPAGRRPSGRLVENAAQGVDRIRAALGNRK